MLLYLSVVSNAWACPTCRWITQECLCNNLSDWFHFFCSQWALIETSNWSCHFRWVVSGMPGHVQSTQKLVMINISTKSKIIVLKFLYGVSPSSRLQINRVILVGSCQACLGMSRVHRNKSTNLWKMFSDCFGFVHVSWLPWKLYIQHVKLAGSYVCLSYSLFIPSIIFYLEKVNLLIKFA